MVNNMFFAGAGGAAQMMPSAGGGMRRALLDHAGWIIGAGVAGAAIAWLVATARPEVYSASALIQVLQPREGGAQRIANAGLPAGSASSSVSIDTGMLRSRAVVAPVVEHLHLDISAVPVRAPFLGAVAAHFATPGRLAGPWPASLGYAWGGEKIAVERLTVPDRLINVPLTLEVLPGSAYRVYDRDTLLLEGVAGTKAESNGIHMLVARIDAHPRTRFTVTRHDLLQTVDSVADTLRIDTGSKDTGTVGIAWLAADGVAAAALVNGITQSFIDAQAAQRRDDEAATQAYLASEMPRVKTELERAEAALTRYRSHSGSMQPSQDAQSYLTGSMDYQRQIALLKLERTKLLQRFTEEANEVKTVDSQIQQMIRERRDMDARLQSLPATERESVALTRDVKVAEDMYMTLRNKAEQLSLSQLDRTGQVRVLDAALVPVRPVGMGPWPMTSGGGLIGLCLAMACITVRQRMKPTLDTVNDAELRLGLPMLGDVVFSQEQAELERLVDARLHSVYGQLNAAGLLERPSPGHAVVTHGERAENGGHDSAERLLRLGLHDQFLLARNAPHSMAVEELRSVRAALHFTLRGTRDKVLAVTSPTAGAGKTFVSVNLAVLFAEAGQRVLLVDADLRRGKVASWFDLPADVGLAEVLAGHAPLSEAVQPTVVTGLSVLPAGTHPSNPSELLMHPAMEACMQACKERFDLVLFDTSPVLAVADATFVANLAGATLLVLRADTTLPAQVDETLKRLGRADARMLGGILNGVRPRRSNQADYRNMNPYLGMPLTATPVPRLERSVAAESSDA